MNKHTVKGLIVGFPCVIRQSDYSHVSLALKSFTRIISNPV